MTPQLLGDEDAGPEDLTEDYYYDDVTDPLQEKASRLGALYHMGTGKVHLCHEGGLPKTKCGSLEFCDELEMISHISEYHIFCARCFDLETVSLPGRQAVVL